LGKEGLLLATSSQKKKSESISVCPSVFYRPKCFHHHQVKNFLQQKTSNNLVLKRVFMKVLQSFFNVNFAVGKASLSSQPVRATVAKEITWHLEYIPY